MALFVELCVSLKVTSICIVDADGSPVWEGKAESELTSLIKALHCRGRGERSVRFHPCAVFASSTRSQLGRPRLAEPHRGAHLRVDSGQKRGPGRSRADAADMRQRSSPERAETLCGSGRRLTPASRA